MVRRRNYRMTTSCLVCQFIRAFGAESEEGPYIVYECHNGIDVMRISPAYVCDQFELSQQAYKFVGKIEGVE